MATSNDSSARVAHLASLAPGAHFYIAGICGKGTASVAALLKQLGYRVSGSDKAFHPPMSEVVRAVADKLYEGFDASNLSERPDVVLIGNAISADNPEAVFVAEENIPFASMPEVLEALLIGSREHCSTSVVVTGTHGKTTTAAAAAVMFESAGWKPGYFIGGVADDLPSSIRAVSQEMPLEKRLVVLEGDEYDSAYFAKWSKFHSYRPDIAIITSLEFDHADIFESIEAIEAEFNAFVKRVPKDGLVLVCDQDQRLIEAAVRWQNDDAVEAPIALYGRGKESGYRLLERSADASGGQALSFKLGGDTVQASTPLSGEYNALNLLAVAAVAHHKGISHKQIAEGVQAFHGVRQRQQVVFDDRGITVIEDFAHHPTAVRVTLEGLREQYPEKRLIAVFEPRSNTSRRSFFQEQYPSSFESADVVLMKEVIDSGGYSNTSAAIEALDVKQVVAAIGEQAKSYPSVPAIKDWLSKNLTNGDVCVIMSNGDFDGLVPSLVESLSKS